MNDWVALLDHGGQMIDIRTLWQVDERHIIEIDKRPMAVVDS